MTYLLGAARYGSEPVPSGVGVLGFWFYFVSNNNPGDFKAHHSTGVPPMPEKRQPCARPKYDCEAPTFGNDAGFFLRGASVIERGFCSSLVLKALVTRNFAAMIQGYPDESDKVI